MAGDYFELTEEQWQFLAVLKALGRSSSIELIGDLMPLKPGPLFELLKIGKKNHFLQQKDDDWLVLEKDLPEPVQRKITTTNNQAFLSGLAERVQSNQFKDKIEPEALIQLLEKIGKVKEAAEIEFKLVQRAQAQKQPEQVKYHLYHIINLLFDSSQDAEIGSMFANAVLRYSNICFFLGQNLDEIEKYLHRAQEVTKVLGDKRSHGLIALHFGRLFYLRDRRDNALTYLSTGFEEIKELGDDDILSQSSGFLGIYFFIQGMYREALEYLEKAEQLYESYDDYIPTSPLAPFFMGFSAAYLGQFHRAVGTLDYHWQLARKRSDHILATALRAQLGTVLMVMRNIREGLPHLEQSRQEALASNNFMALYLNGGGFALYHFIEGRMEKAYEVLKQTYSYGIRVGFIRQYSSPWVLEMLYEFYRLGFKPIPGMGYLSVQTTILKGVNIHLRGVVLRLKAKELISKNDNREQVLKILSESEKCLEKSGDQMQQAKTILQIARLHLDVRNRKSAQQLAKKAWGLLGQCAEKYFPDELRILLEKTETSQHIDKYRESFLKRYFVMWEELFPVQEPEEMMARVVRSTNRLFGAERGGLFWFTDSKFTHTPELRAAFNLSSQQVETPEFKPNLQVVLDSFKKKEPLVVRQKQTGDQASVPQAHSILCIPIEIQSKIQGILYYDNSYLDDAFDFLNISTMQQMAHHNSIIIERLTDYLTTKKQNRMIATQKAFSTSLSETRELIGESGVMKKLRKQADKAAMSDSTVLILGESGTGKELLAERVRQKSRRSDQPLVIVDVTTIPENLFESELFGHEKGAFTGADRRKIGYVELAHSGTLFLDEVGELPLLIQSRLLRVLQEKTFSRVGGTRSLKSDFRLVAATNRDLAKEVEARRFREDLYYRLNVVPLELPPLKKRGQDILLLTRHFIEVFKRKHGYEDLRLTHDDENAILKYQWPGNVRELQNVIERAVILSHGQQLELNIPNSKLVPGEDLISDRPSLDELQRRYIHLVLNSTGGKVGGPDGASSILGMKRTSLYSRMRALNMKPR